MEVEDSYSSSKFHLIHNVDSQGKVHVTFDEIPPGGSKSFNVTIKPLQGIYLFSYLSIHLLMYLLQLVIILLLVQHSVIIMEVLQLLLQLMA